MKKLFLITPVLISVGIIFQIIYFIMLILALENLSPVTHYCMIGIGITVALMIASGEDSAIYKMAWIIPVLLFPAVFGIVYVFYNRRPLGRMVDADLMKSQKIAKQYIIQNNLVLKEECFSSKTDYLTANYIKNTSGFGCSYSSDAQYFKTGEEFFENFILELKEARSYIFIEFFIIEQGVMWDSILKVLEEKVKNGVDVRVIYDGAGSLFTLPYSYYKTLRKKGLKCMVFNPFRLAVSNRSNIRNHRKLAVVDGITAFSGGLNLADNYINKSQKAKKHTGYWKDTSVMVRGEAAWSYTLMFLSMWEFLSRKKVDYKIYKTNLPENKNKTTNAISVWSDIPLDSEPFSERLILNLILRAESHVHIITPYLLPSSQISAALCLAARSGIDVKIILPFLPDKYVIQAVTKSNYLPLLSAGVKIYEYTPGFIHGKNIIIDGKRAILSTVNFDFRSMFMHHECGSCFFGGDIVDKMNDDFIITQKSCEEITIDKHSKANAFTRGVRRFCRLFEPFM